MWQSAIHFKPVMKIFKYFIAFTLYVGFAGNLSAQGIDFPKDSTALDSTMIATGTPTESGGDSTNELSNKGKIGRFLLSDYPNPKKAALFSLVLPGSGQAYNRKWWKIPIVYAGLGALTWVEINNINTYRLYKTNYKNLVDGDPSTIVEDPRLQLQDRVTMKANRDTARKNLEQSSLILGLGYLLSVTDAFVDAHLASFDVSDDLTLRFKAISQNGYPGLSLVLSVHP
jgi:hypothetical protein